MALKPAANLIDFFEQVRLCKGEVHFITDEQDTINMKSQLCQYLFTAAYLNKDITLNGRIDCQLPEDTERLAPFLL